MLEAIHHHDLDRHSYVLVCGGGAVLDAVGYAASIAHRGIRLVRIPTTTLAQADSGVGVKTAVNAFGKKNWIGTFAVPWAVINDARILLTLPDRDWNCGFAEATKVALLKDPIAFSQLEVDATRIRRRELPAAWPALCRSVRLHLEHITAGGDPFEMQQARPLDFGHWSAHKLEPLSDYRLRHGEAVAIGVSLDAYYSALVHGLPLSDADRIVACLHRLGLPVQDELLHDPRLLDGLEEFRQHLGGQLTVTMLRGIGNPIDVHVVDRRQMARAIELLEERRSHRDA
jgi:3-dehydroquinate synthase